jgi:hypothetical protein
MDLQGEVITEFDLKHSTKNSAAEGIRRFKNFLVYVIKQVLKSKK